MASLESLGLVLAQRQYQYSPLDTTKSCFRLLRLQFREESGHEPIQCKLSHGLLNRKADFIALSYTWDQPRTPLRQILCDDAVLHIGQNLWNFLDRYSKRQEYTEIQLWVDAICIDQNNVLERNHQVPQMRKIYSLAQSVISWLGEQVGNDVLAFHAAHQGFEDPDYVLTTRAQDAVISLFQKRYWTRTWTIQEYILPRIVYIWCGELSAHADCFDQAWPTRVWSRLRDAQCAWNIVNFRRIWHQKVHHCSSTEDDIFRLCRLVRMFAYSECLEPYDRIYGVLGLASAADSNARIDPDYLKTPADLLIDVLRYDRDTGASSSEMMANLTQIGNLLGVSSVELAQAVRCSTGSIQQHMYALLGYDNIVSPLRFICSVYETYTSPARRRRLRRTDPSRIRHYTRGAAKLKWMATKLHKRKRAVREQTRSHPSFADNPCSWESYRDGREQSAHDSEMFDNSMALLLKHLIRASDFQTLNSPRKHGQDAQELRDYEEMFLSSFDRDPWVSASVPDVVQPFETDQDWTSFKGTNGVRGYIVTDEAKSIDLWRNDYAMDIWTFNGSSTPERGFLVGKDNYGDWRIQGFVIFEFTKNESVKVVKPDYSSLHEDAPLITISPSARMSLDDLNERDEEGLWMRLDLATLLVLQRCGILSRAQLQHTCKLWLSGGSTGERSMDTHLRSP
jgi:hypothetical protein